MKLYFRMWTGINYVVVSKFMHICMNLRQLVKYLIWVLVSLLLLFVILRTFHLCTKWESALPLVPYSAIINPWEFFGAPQLQEPQKDSRVCILPSTRFLVIQICFRMFGDGTVTLTTQISLTAEIRTSNIPHAIRLLYMFHYWPILSLNLVICLWS